MGLCEIVADLARSIVAVRQPLTPREAFLLFVLEGMPRFRDVSKLDLWEAVYGKVASDTDATATEQLIAAVYELGEHNLYAAFDVAGTQAICQETRSRLAAAGVLTTAPGPIVAW